MERSGVGAYEHVAIWSQGDEFPLQSGKQWPEHVNFIGRCVKHDERDWEGRKVLLERRVFVDRDERPERGTGKGKCLQRGIVERDASFAKAPVYSELSIETGKSSGELSLTSKPPGCVTDSPIA